MSDWEKDRQDQKRKRQTRKGKKFTLSIFIQFCPNAGGR